MLIYLVQSGDTVTSIARTYQIPAETVIYDNQLEAPFFLTPGQTLLLAKADDPTTEPPQKRPLHTTGYAYPFIRREILEQTLPYLTDLSVFSYGFTADGMLIPPALDDTWMIGLAHSYGTAPILVLTPFGPDGRFNNRLISSIVNDTDARRRLKDEIIGQITTRGFQGLDIDFEYIPARDRQAFSDFVFYMREAVGALGFPVSVALAPKTSDEQQGLLYEGKDYAALGAAADYVFLMTYEWGYTYGPPMAVAPLNKVREVVEYALTKIPREKIHLGIPNYGYDWPLPFIRGETKAETLGNIQAVQRAVSYNAEIFFDETARAPYYRYQTDQQSHEVWFEDVRSMNDTFQLIEEYQLHGAGYWNIMQLFRANWLLLDHWFTPYRPQPA